MSLLRLQQALPWRAAATIFSRPLHISATSFSSKAPPARSPLDDDGQDEAQVDFTKPIDEEIIDDAPRSRRSGSYSKEVFRDPLPSTYRAHRETMKQKFPDGWNPPRKISREAMDDLRMTHRLDPDKFSTEELANRYRISPEAVRRIIRSKWTPSAQRADEKAAKEAEEKDQRVAYFRQLREKRKQRQERERARHYGPSAPSRVENPPDRRNIRKERIEQKHERYDPRSSFD